MRYLIQEQSLRYRQAVPLSQRQLIKMIPTKFAQNRERSRSCVPFECLSTISQQGGVVYAACFPRDFADPSRTHRAACAAYRSSLPSCPNGLRNRIPRSPGSWRPHAGAS